MGYLTRELDSTALSNIYPAFYRELQIHNWTPVDVVITDRTGHQSILQSWPKSGNIGTPYVEIEYRECTGMRSQETKGRTIDLPIPTKKYTVNYGDFVLYPVLLEELDLIISTKEHSLVAKSMIAESKYSPDYCESLTDFETTDPRFVFEVKDPFNRWDCLYVNILGQTITLRCGHSNQLISDLDEETTKTLSEECTLSCYLRYPSNYAQVEHETVPVFTVNLKDLDLEEPYQLQSGDIICVASSLEALQRVVGKKHEGNHSIVQINGMISKEVHDQVVQNLKDQNEQDKKSASDQIRSIRVQKDAEIAELKAQLDASKRKCENSQQQLTYWHDLHESSIERLTREDKLVTAREKMRQESYDASLKTTDNTMTMLKVGATAAAGILSFVLAFSMKSKK